MIVNIPNSSNHGISRLGNKNKKIRKIGLNCNNLYPCHCRNGKCVVLCIDPLQRQYGIDDRLSWGLRIKDSPTKYANLCAYWTGVGKRIEPCFVVNK